MSAPLLPPWISRNKPLRPLRHRPLAAADVLVFLRAERACTRAAVRRVAPPRDVCRNGCGQAAATIWPPRRRPAPTSPCRGWPPAPPCPPTPCCRCCPRRGGGGSWCWRRWACGPAPRRVSARRLGAEGVVGCAMPAVGGRRRRLGRGVGVPRRHHHVRAGRRRRRVLHHQAGVAGPAVGGGRWCWRRWVCGPAPRRVSARRLGAGGVMGCAVSAVGGRRRRCGRGVCVSCHRHHVGGGRGRRAVLPSPGWCRVGLGRHGGHGVANA